MSTASAHKTHLLICLRAPRGHSTSLLPSNFYVSARHLVYSIEANDTITVYNV